MESLSAKYSAVYRIQTYQVMTGAYFETPEVDNMEIAGGGDRVVV